MNSLLRLLSGLLLIGTLGPVSASASEVDLLFIGNSYIASNDLPGTVSSLLQASLPVVDVRTESHAPGGRWFTDHLAEADGSRGETALSQWLTTDAVGWHHVFLQEQSQIPGFYDLADEYDASMEAFLVLNTLVAAAPGQPETLLLMTWGRRDGDSTNSVLYPDFLAMQARIEEGYRRYAAAGSSEERTVWIVPAGLAFQAVYEQDLAQGEKPEAEGSCFHQLYSGDGSHPSPLGTWVAAATIVAVL